MRYSTFLQVTEHPFFDQTRWDDLRGTAAPFVPELDSEIDAGYYDDFTSPQDMAKYCEVKEKQRNVARVKEKKESFGRGVWVGFTFGKNGPSAKTTVSGSGDDGALATMF